MYGLYFYYTVFSADERSKNIDTYYVLYISHQKQSKFGQHPLKIYGSATLKMQKIQNKSFLCVILVWGQKGCPILHLFSQVLIFIMENNTSMSITRRNYSYGGCMQILLMLSWVVEWRNKRLEKMLLYKLLEKMMKIKVDAILFYQ